MCTKTLMIITCIVYKWDTYVNHIDLQNHVAKKQKKKAKIPPSNSFKWFLYTADFLDFQVRILNILDTHQFPPVYLLFHQDWYTVKTYQK